MSPDPESSSATVHALSAAILPGPVACEGGQAGARWSALHEAAGVVALLAGLTPEPSPAQVRQFPMTIGTVGGWRQALAEQGVDDLAAIMEPGIAALLAVHARGVSCGTAALALWREFLRARGAVLALAPPDGPGRSRLV